MLDKSVEDRRPQSDFAHIGDAVIEGRHPMLREIGKALGVATILEGSVRRIGNRVRVNVQLINAHENDEHLWAEDYDRELTDVVRDSNRSAPKIAGELRAKLSPSEKAQIEH